MCQAEMEWGLECFIKGFIEGYIEGFMESTTQMLRLMNILLSKNRFDDAKRATYDEDYRDMLMKEFNLSYKGKTTIGSPQNIEKTDMSEDDMELAMREEKVSAQLSKLLDTFILENRFDNVIRILEDKEYCDKLLEELKITQ